MKKIRQVDEDFKRRSSQCSKNRLQNESQRVHHRQGSISAEEVKINMEKELARLPTAPELYYDGHVDNDGQFVNPKAKQVWYCSIEVMMGYRLLVCRWRREADVKLEPHNWDYIVLMGRCCRNLMSFRRRKPPTSNKHKKKSEDKLFMRPTCEEKNGKKSRREYIKSLETQVVELAAKNDDQQKELDQTKQELDQTKQELGETKQGLVDTQTNLVRTQQVLIKTKKKLAETNESFMTFKKQVEKFMQANPSRS
ncbi:Adventurous-gliding motility protein Z [Bienertia sinuspersici]